MSVASITSRHALAAALVALPVVLAACKSDKVTGTGPGPGTAASIAFSSCAGNDCDIFVVRSDGANLQTLLGGPTIDLEPRYSPDGSKIVFVRGPDGHHQIFRMNADGTNVVQLTNNASNDDTPAWSPDGTKVIFYSTRDGTAIWVMNADGTNQRKLTNNIGIRPVWSPDGIKVAFNSAENGLSQIYTMLADGTGITRISDQTRSEQAPAWSPDGKKIAFHSASSASPRFDIWVMNADGTGRAQLTHNTSTNAYQPAWSADGTRFAFVLETATDSNIYTMNADGTNTLRLTNTGGAKVLPSWHP